MLDPVKNFGIVTVSTGYSDSDTSIVLSGGDGAILPDPSTDGAFNLVWYNASDYFNPTDDPNKELVRVTARSTDTLTVVRAQEGTSASTKNTAGKTYKMVLAFTKKMRDDIDRILAGLPEGSMWNGKIVPTVSSNNLTLSLKTLAGNDPSSSDPAYIMIGGSVRPITSALSVTVSAGTNTMNMGSAELATKEVDLFAMLGYNATDGVVIGFSRYPGGRQYSDFSTTATNEKYMAVSNRTNAASTDYYEVIGRFAATLSAGAGYTWSVPTYTAKNLIQRPIYETRLLSYLPVGPTNTTLSSNYKLIGSKIIGEMKGILTGTPSFTNMPTLPFTVASSSLAVTAYSPCGNGGYLDNGTATFMNGCMPQVQAASTRLGLMANLNGGNYSATIPITWVSGDAWYCTYSYEI